MTEGVSWTKEHNTPQGVASILMFVSAFASVFLAAVTASMVCETRRAADAAFEANELARRESQPHLRISVSVCNSWYFVRDGSCVRLNGEALAPGAGTSYFIIKRWSSSARPVVASVKDSLLKLVQTCQADEPHFTRVQLTDTVRPWRGGMTFLHLCLAYPSTSGGRIFYYEGTYRVKPDMCQAPESLRLELADVPLQGYFARGRFTKEQY